MSTHSSTLAWKIPWTEDPGGLQSMGLQRVGHDWATSLSLSRLLITFLPRSNCLLISWLRSPSAVILEPLFLLFPHLFAMKRWDQMPRSQFSECWALSELCHSLLSLSSRGSLVPLHFLPLDGSNFITTWWQFVGDCFMLKFYVFVTLLGH